ncbi:hypothetical protein M758_9G025100 [Ceratodon purpureus]|nr:hypothetical protein M758_9G025100 [Ceratodon purpureus]
MPGALKARAADGGSTMETTRVVVEKRVVVAGEVQVGGRRDGEKEKEKKKRRKKRRKLSPPEEEKERDFDEPLDRIVRDAMDLSSLSGCASLSNGDVSKVMNQKQTRESPTGNDMETSVTEKAAGRVKLNKKKRKRLEEERLKESTETTTSSLVATTTETTSVDAHKRVWQYVCNRAVLVDSKYVRDSELEAEPYDAQSGFGNNTVVTEIHVAGKKIVVTNTKEGAVAQEWLNRQKGTVFGLDAEWRPSYRKGTEHKVALLQICGESECLIVQMLYLDVIPRGLVNFLKDPAIKFPGVGVQGDAVKLKKDWGLECNGTVDLTTLAAQILGRPELKYTGLKALAKVVMDYDMAKPKRVTMSNWAKPVLDRVQVEYASLDAWVSYAIHQKLFQPDIDS